ncbi:MAG: hypothetical protein HYW88_03550 [Candidatus Sungbacteria bacterium]|nr:hypothetical protein [Candidatus Sungbacteria bacterium]
MKRTFATIGILVVLVGGFVVYYFYFSAGPAIEDFGLEFTVLSPEEQSRLDEYRRIKNISFDQGLLSDSFFRDLEDVIVPPPPADPLGRPNPFLPFEKKQAQTSSGSPKASSPASKPKGA